MKKRITVTQKPVEVPLTGVLIYVFIKKEHIQPKKLCGPRYIPSKEYIEFKERVDTFSTPKRRNIVDTFRFHEIESNRLLNNIFDKERIKPPTREIVWNNAKIG